MTADPLISIDDMSQSIQAILKYVHGMSFEDFLDDGKTIDAVYRRIEILGEAAGRLLR